MAEKQPAGIGPVYLTLDDVLVAAAASAVYIEKQSYSLRLALCG